MHRTIQPYSFETLNSMSTPQKVRGGNMEAVAWDIYDTATYVQGATTNLTFFNNTRATPQLSNLSPAGQFPNPQFFLVYAASLNIIIPPTGLAAQATTIRDMHRLLFGTAVTEGPPTWTFTMANKSTGPFPLSALHAVGGPTGFGYGTNAATGDEWANNGHPGDPGFCFANSVLIPPQQSFNVSCQWDAAQTLAADTRLQFILHGTLYRKIL